MYFLYRVKPFLEVGFETLAGNSTDEEATTMNFQAAGATVELSFGTKSFVASGVHAGAVIANAMHRLNAPSPTGAEAGTFFKQAGWFVAPHVGVGIVIRSAEVRHAGRSHSADLPKNRVGPPCPAHAGE